MNEDWSEYVVESTPSTEISEKLKSIYDKLAAGELEINSSKNDPELSMMTQLVNECDKYISQDLTAGINNISLESSKFNELLPSSVKNPSEKFVANTETLNNIFVKPLEETRSRNCYTFFVFYLIEEILKFTPRFYPKNSNIQVVGVTEYSEESSSCFLCSLEESNEGIAAIKLDNTQLPTAPTSGEEVVMFCDLVFHQDLPIIVGNFFQKFTLSFARYKELMLKLRSTVPVENFEIISIPEDTLDNNVDWKEYVLNSSEIYNSEMQQHIDLSETMLNAFLNDSSFSHV